MRSHSVTRHPAGDFPAFTPAEAGTRFSDPGGMQGWVDLGGGYIPWARTTGRIKWCEEQIVAWTEL